MKVGQPQHADRKADGNIQPERQSPVRANLSIAIQLANLSWAILSQSAGYADAEKPEQEDNTPEEYFYALRSDALEFADGMYGSASEAGRMKEDEDLELLEATGALAENASSRIQALGLLMLAKELVELPWRRLIDAPRVFQD